MAQETKIEWCDSTFNPWMGCTRVSPACDHCYAARSTPARTLGVAWGPGEPRRRTSDANWALPGQWQRQAVAFKATHGRRRRVFCASLADWLDNEVPIQWLVDLLGLIHSTPDLDWLLLSKRIGNWRPRVTAASGAAALQASRVRWPGLAEWLIDWLAGQAPRNVWMLATICNRPEAERDIIKLLRMPAVVHGLSIEPMLGPIDLERPRPGPDLDQGGGRMICQPWLIQSGIDWVICGGESGPKARPMHPDWARSLRDQCAAAGVPFLFKQWGEWLPWNHFQDASVDDPIEQTRFATVERTADGWIDVGRPDIWATMDGQVDDMQCMGRVGKKAAGRLLDGRTHDAWPEVRHG